ncbi:unnamed protein product [Soboliphyme baturini]|uniref:Uncharacterized protein n=1 Tax=Soboliphyme baturini TaxID=241478 RepID=A0A183J5E1_9BILA|nr:unnamed protein product [Soboliphyme baturini]
MVHIYGSTKVQWTVHSLTRDKTKFTIGIQRNTAEIHPGICMTGVEGDQAHDQASRPTTPMCSRGHGVTCRSVGQIRRCFESDVVFPLLVAG